jgi:pilus assembly protein CpaC
MKLIILSLVTAIVTFSSYGQTNQPPEVDPTTVTNKPIEANSNSRIVDYGTKESQAASSNVSRNTPKKASIQWRPRAPDNNSRAVSISKTFSLLVGEVRVIDRPNVARIAIGNGRIASATVIDDKQIVLLGDTPGDTNLYVWLRDGTQVAYEVLIRPDSANKMAREVESLLGSNSSVQVRVSGDNVVLEGGPMNAETASKVDTLTKRFPKLINLIVPTAAKIILPVEKMIYLDVKVVEVRKKALDRLGIKWSDVGVDGPAFATSGYFYANSTFRPPNTLNLPSTTSVRPFLSYLGLATQITSKLNFLEQSGDSWTLAEPRLSCKSGGQSKFQVGGEIPIPVAGAFGAINIVYKEYGIILEFQPISDEQGQISSKISIEVSEPDTRNASGGFVAFTKNKTETQVSLQDGQTLVLSGLLKQRGQRSKDEVPGLAKIPLIGALFRTKDFDNEQIEVVVMVTPKIAGPDSTVNQEQMLLGKERVDKLNEIIKNRLAE